MLRKLILVPALLALACTAPDRSELSAEHRIALADSISALVRAAYADIGEPSGVNRMMALYPDGGRIVSAGGGTATLSRDTLEQGIRTFWDDVGSRMVEPDWQWRGLWVDVLSRDAAVMTAVFRVPHHSPDGIPHVIGGAWTAAFARRDGRWVIVQEHLSDAPAAQINHPDSLPAPHH